MELSLKSRIVRFLKARPTEVWAKEELIRMITSRTTYSSENVGRRLRELEVEGKLKVTHPKGHSHYQWNDHQLDMARQIAIFDAL